MDRRTFLATAACGLARTAQPAAAATIAAPAPIDAQSLDRKILCGYQGWFRTPGDDSNRGWVHWSRDARRFTPETVTVEMWPDVSEYPEESLHAADGFTFADGTPARVFSSTVRGTVDLHFRWMQDYGLDGVLLQRFLVDVKHHRADVDRVLGHVREAAKQTGRVFAVEYDLSGLPANELVATIRNDWHRLVDELRLPQDDRYLHHAARPVVGIFGFFPDRFAAATAHEILDLFTADKYRAHVIGGPNWTWRRDADTASDWGRVFRRFQTIAPWNIGNAEGPRELLKAKTSTWPEDQAEAKRVGMQFMPVVYPGFRWDNLKQQPPGTSTIPRRNGDFLGEQFAAASELNVSCIKVAMFDEVDEGTAIFKVTNSPPRESHFQTYDNLPSDFYLRLTGEATRQFRDGTLDAKRPP